MIFVQVVAYFLQLLAWVVIADALLSWVQPNPASFPRRLTNPITQHLYAPIHAIWRPVIAGLDFTPILVIVVLNTLSGALYSALG